MTIGIATQILMQLSGITTVIAVGLRRIVVVAKWMLIMKPAKMTLARASLRTFRSVTIIKHALRIPMPAVSKL